MKFSLNPKTYLEADSKELFLFSLRWSFGFWFLFIGLSKWFKGADKFVGYITSEFSTTFLPEALVHFTGWIILILEPLLGLLLMIGFFPRATWLVTAKLLFILMLGKSILGDHQTVSNNWFYIVLALGAGSFSKKT